MLNATNVWSGGNTFDDGDHPDQPVPSLRFPPQGRSAVAA